MQPLIGWTWTALTSEPAGGSGPLPGARLGHTAIYDAPRNRILVFGGATSEAGALADNDIWEMTIQITPPKAIWRKLTDGTTTPKPSARFGHTLVMDSAERDRLAGTSEELWGRAFLFGGQTGASTYDDELWALWIKKDTGALEWKLMTTLADGGNGKPTSRADHAAIYDRSSHRVVLSGGATGGASDATTWAAEVQCDPCLDAPIQWRKLQNMTDARARHAAWFVGNDIFTRESEIFTPVSGYGGEWWLREDAPLSQDYFPFNFVLPQPGVDTVFTAGPGSTSYLLKLAGGPWTAAGSSGFVGGSAVMYLPGKVLKCGSRDSEEGTTAVTTTKTIDLAPGSRAWQPSGAMTHGRVNHNLTVLPTGEVIVSGGTSFVDNHPSSPPTARRQPELWSPSQGVWYGGGSPPNVLESDPMVRDYHSGLLLLPDGRLLSGGGEFYETQRGKATVFTPPYLFDASGRVVGSPGCLVSRPVVTGTLPIFVTSGQVFTIGTPNPGAITSVCLIRPGAVTHGYDQSQRYVPLAFTILPDNSGLRVVAPLTGNQAPPSDYLLFLVNTDGVPSIGRWMRLANCNTAPCDTDSPPQVSDLSPDIVGPNEVWLVWTAPGDYETAVAGEYDLRIAATTIASENAYAVAGLVSGEPGVANAGTPVTHTEFGLAPCTEYSFALKTRDGIGPSFKNWSALSNPVTVTTTCQGGAGGGYSAREVDGSREDGMLPATRVRSAPGDRSVEGSSTVSGPGIPVVAPAGAGSVGGATGVLVAETEPTAAGGWGVTLRLVPQVDGVDAPDADAIVAQVRDDAGRWRTLGRYRPTPGPLGLCALRDRGRVVFPAGYGLDRLQPNLRTGAQDLALGLASHSRLGTVAAGSIAGGEPVQMTLGDVLSIRYDPTGSAPGDAASWYLLVRPNGIEAPTATPARRALTSSLPARFALHLNQPNPFGRATTIGFDLPIASPVTIEVFDLLGRRVVTLAQGEYPAGAHTVEWDLSADGGATVRPGIYVYRMAAGEFRERRKMSVIP